MLAVVYFPKANLDKITEMRSKYDINWKIIHPHITIVSPVSELSKNQLIEHVENLVENIQSFPICLTGLSKTSDGCLFLVVKEGKDKIVALHKKLYSGILAPYIPTTYQFTPHITLGDFAKPDKKLLDRAYSEAQTLNLDFVDIFDSLTVVEGDGVSQAKNITVINLSKDKTIV